MADKREQRKPYVRVLDYMDFVAEVGKVNSLPASLDVVSITDCPEGKLATKIEIVNGKWSIKDIQLSESSRNTNPPDYFKGTIYNGSDNLMRYETANSGRNGQGVLNLSGLTYGYSDGIYKKDKPTMTVHPGKNAPEISAIFSSPTSDNINGVSINSEVSIINTYLTKETYSGFERAMRTTKPFFRVETNQLPSDLSVHEISQIANSFLPQLMKEDSSFFSHHGDLQVNNIYRDYEKVLGLKEVEAEMHRLEEIYVKLRDSQRIVATDSSQNINSFITEHISASSKIRDSEDFKYEVNQSYQRIRQLQIEHQISEITTRLESYKNVELTPNITAQVFDLNQRLNQLSDEANHYKAVESANEFRSESWTRSINEPIGSFMLNFNEELRAKSSDVNNLEANALVITKMSELITSHPDLKHTFHPNDIYEVRESMLVDSSTITKIKDIMDPVRDREVNLSLLATRSGTHNVLNQLNKSINDTAFTWETKGGVESADTKTIFDSKNIEDIKGEIRNVIYATTDTVDDRISLNQINDDLVKKVTQRTLNKLYTTNGDGTTTDTSANNRLNEISSNAQRAEFELLQNIVRKQLIVECVNNHMQDNQYKVDFSTSQDLMSIHNKINIANYIKMHEDEIKRLNMTLNPDNTRDGLERLRSEVVSLVKHDLNLSTREKELIEKPSDNFFKSHIFETLITNPQAANSIMTFGMSNGDQINLPVIFHEHKIIDIMRNPELCERAISDLKSVIKSTNDKDLGHSSLTTIDDANLKTLNLYLNTLTEHVQDNNIRLTQYSTEIFNKDIDDQVRIPLPKMSEIEAIRANPNYKDVSISELRNIEFVAKNYESLSQIKDGDKLVLNDLLSRSTHTYSKTLVTAELLEQVNLEEKLHIEIINSINRNDEKLLIPEELKQSVMNNTGMNEKEMDNKISDIVNNYTQMSDKERAEIIISYNDVMSKINESQSADSNDKLKFSSAENLNNVLKSEIYREIIESVDNPILQSRLDILNYHIVTQADTLNKSSINAENSIEKLYMASRLDTDAIKTYAIFNEATCQANNFNHFAEISAINQDSPEALKTAREDYSKNQSFIHAQFKELSEGKIDSKVFEEIFEARKVVKMEEIDIFKQSITDIRENMSKATDSNIKFEILGEVNGNLNSGQIYSILTDAEVKNSLQHEVQKELLSNPFEIQRQVLDAHIQKSENILREIEAAQQRLEDMKASKTGITIPIEGLITPEVYINSTREKELEFNNPNQSRTEKPEVQNQVEPETRNFWDRTKDMCVNLHAKIISPKQINNEEAITISKDVTAMNESLHQEIKKIEELSGQTIDLSTKNSSVKSYISSIDSHDENNLVSVQESQAHVTYNIYRLANKLEEDMSKISLSEETSNKLKTFDSMLGSNVDNSTKIEAFKEVCNDIALDQPFNMKINANIEMYQSKLEDLSRDNQHVEQFITLNNLVKNLNNIEYAQDNLTPTEIRAIVHEEIGLSVGFQSEQLKNIERDIASIYSDLNQSYENWQNKSQYLDSIKEAISIGVENNSSIIKIMSEVKAVHDAHNQNVERLLPELEDSVAKLVAAKSIIEATITDAKKAVIDNEDINTFIKLPDVLLSAQKADYNDNIISSNIDDIVNRYNIENQSSLAYELPVTEGHKFNTYQDMLAGNAEASIMKEIKLESVLQEEKAPSKDSAIDKAEEKELEEKEKDIEKKLEDKAKSIEADSLEA